MTRHLIRAASPIIFDSLGMIFFALLLALHVSVVLATIVGVALACGVVGWELARRRTVPALQWMSLAIVLASAAATLFTGDPRFVMVKPTIVYAAIGTAMLQKGWMIRYVDPRHVDDIRDLMTVSGYVWAGLMFVTALANLVIAMAVTAWWPAFIAVFPLGSKLALFAANFAVVYAIGRSRRLANKSNPSALVAPAEARA